MRREDKVISLDLAKQIDVEHKRLKVEVESEWIWYIGRLDDGCGLENYKDIKKYLDGADETYPAYDCAELGEMLKHRETEGLNIYEFCHTPSLVNGWWKADSACINWHFVQTNIKDSKTEAEARGKMYLWLLKEGYLLKAMGEKGDK